MPSVVTTKDYEHQYGGGVPLGRMYAFIVPEGSVFDAKLEGGYYVGDWGSMNGTRYIEVPAEICQPYSEERMQRAMAKLHKLSDRRHQQEQTMTNEEALKTEHRKLQQKLDALAWIDQHGGNVQHSMSCASEDMSGHPAPCTCGMAEVRRIPDYLKQLVLKS